MGILKSNINYVNWVVLYLWCLNINYVNWVVLYLWSLNINYVDEFSLYLWRWNVVKIHTGKLWVFQETLLLGSNTLINFFSIFQETLLLGRHFHSGLQSKYPPSISNITVDEKGVLNLLTKLNTNKASGPGGISNRFLKACASEITPLLTQIFQMSLNSHNLLEDWRTANISPIFKKGYKHLPSNYRPV